MPSNHSLVTSPSLSAQDRCLAHCELDLGVVAIHDSSLGPESVVVQGLQLPGVAKPCPVGVDIGWLHPLTNGLPVQYLETIFTSRQPLIIQSQLNCLYRYHIIMLLYKSLGKLPFRIKLY